MTSTETGLGIEAKSDAIYELVEEGSKVERLATGFTFTINEQVRASDNDPFARAQTLHDRDPIANDVSELHLAHQALADYYERTGETTRAAQHRAGAAASPQVTREP